MSRVISVKRIGGDSRRSAKPGNSPRGTGNVSKESGVFECPHCYHRITMKKGNRFPPCSSDGAVKWTAGEITSGPMKRRKDSPYTRHR